MQQFIPANVAAYNNNSMNNNYPRPAKVNQGRGFITTPSRRMVDAAYIRDVSPTFLDYWSQPRLFWNSMLPAEKQMIVNAFRFELGKVQTTSIRQAMVGQLNRISNDLAIRVATAIGVLPPSPDPEYYHHNETIGLSIFNEPLKTVAGLNVAVLATMNSTAALTEAKGIAQSLTKKGANAMVIAEATIPGVDTAYVAADASMFDGFIVVDGTADLFDPIKSMTTPMFPPRRPLEIVTNGFSQGKAITVIGSGKEALKQAALDDDEMPGIRTVGSASGAGQTVIGTGFLHAFEEDLKIFKFLDRYPLDPPPSEWLPGARASKTASNWISESTNHIKDAREKAKGVVRDWEIF